MKLVFLNVGQGDATVILGPSGRIATVVDCAQAVPVLEFLQTSGVGIINTIVLSHSDLDHAGGLVELIKNYSGVVEIVRFNIDNTKIQLGLRKRAIFEALLEERERRGFVCAPAYAFETWQIDGIEHKVIHPTFPDGLDFFLSGKVNDASVVIRLSWRDCVVLLTGDAGEGAWSRIVERESDLTAHVFKLPHHGAYFAAADKRLELDAVLKRVDPKLVVISAGSGNAYGHPDPRVLDILAEHGTCRVAITNAPDVNIPGSLEPRIAVPQGGSILVNMAPPTLSVTEYS